MIDNKSPFDLLISKLGVQSMDRLATKVVMKLEIKEFRFTAHHTNL